MHVLWSDFCWSHDNHRNSLWYSGRSVEVDDLTLLSDSHPLHQQQPGGATSSGSDVIMTSPFSTSSTSGGKITIILYFNSEESFRCTLTCLCAEISHVFLIIKVILIVKLVYSSFSIYYIHGQCYHEWALYCTCTCTWCTHWHTCTLNYHWRMLVEKC